MVVNSTLIKDDRRVLAIKELSKLLKDKNYNFDKEILIEKESTRGLLSFMKLKTTVGK